MNDIMEKILTAPLDPFEQTLYRAEDWLLHLEGRIRYSAEISRTLDKSYDLLLVGLALSQDDDDDARESTGKARTLVKQYRGFRDTDTGELLKHVITELHALHALYKGRAP